MDLREHLTTLSELHAPTAHEGPIRDYLREYWREWVDTFEVDGMGNLIGIKRGRGKEPRPRLMLCAHMDEIALVVAEIRDGYLRTERINGIDPRTLQAKSVMVHGKRPLVGTVAAVPPHISRTSGAGRKKYPALEEQWIDLGLPAEEVEELVSLGDYVTLDAQVIKLKGGLLAGKSFDDRASVAAVSFCLELLQKRLHDWDVVAVASVQEEKGRQGARTAAYYVQPDAAVALDVTFGKQPGINDDNAPTVGEGLTIGVGPGFHPGWQAWIQKLAGECDIPLQEDPISRADSGTDAWAIQVAREGVPTSLLSIPIRNMHSPIETVSLKDIKRTGRLLAEIVTTLSDTSPEDILLSRPSGSDDDETEEEDS